MQHNTTWTNSAATETKKLRILYKKNGRAPREIYNYSTSYKKQRECSNKISSTRSRQSENSGEKRIWLRNLSLSGSGVASPPRVLDHVNSFKLLVLGSTSTRVLLPLLSFIFVNGIFFRGRSSRWKKLKLILCYYKFNIS